MRPETEALGKGTAKMSTTSKEKKDEMSNLLENMTMPDNARMDPGIQLYQDCIPLISEQHRKSVIARAYLLVHD